MGTWFATTDQINYVLNAARKVLSREYRKGALQYVSPVIWIFPDGENGSSIELNEHSTPDQYQKVGEMMAAESESFMGKLPYDPLPFLFHNLKMDKTGIRSAVVLAVDMKNGAKLYLNKNQSITQQFCEQFVDNWIQASPEINDEKRLGQVYDGARQRWEEGREAV